MMSGGKPRSLLQTLLAEPARFGFDAAMAILMRAAGTSKPGDAVRFHANAGLGFVAADMTAIERTGSGFRMSTGMLGLTGPSGVLPRPYSDVVNGEQRRHAPALGAFLDLLAQRPMAQFAAAGIKYQPHRAAQAVSAGSVSATVPTRRDSRPDPADGLQHILLALTGYGTPHLAPRLEVGPDPLLFYAGLFASRPRSATRLAAMLSDWMEQPVQVEQFDGAWLQLGASEVSALPKAGFPGQFNRLGVDAAIGSRSWDLQARIRLRIGALTLGAFNALLPGRPLFRRLVSLVQAFLDGETEFVINPVLAASEVPALVLQPGSELRLGWNSWLPTGGLRRRDGVEAIFETDGFSPADGMA